MACKHRIIDKDITKLLNDLESRDVDISSILLDHILKINDRLKAPEKDGE